jgi:dihydrofolate reductase
LTVFNNVTADGFFAGESGDISWFKGQMDAEFSAFVAENATGGGQLLFGRITYDLMASYWPTPFAAENDPVIARHMNGLSKVVFSRTLTAATWQNTKLVSGDLVMGGLVGEVRRMKEGDGPGMTILGSGSIVAQLAQAGLIDEYQFVVNPVVIGTGMNMFAAPLRMRLLKTRSFGNGNVVLWYEPAS